MLKLGFEPTTSDYKSDMFTNNTSLAFKNYFVVGLVL